MTSEFMEVPVRCGPLPGASPSRGPLLSASPSRICCRLEVLSLPLSSCGRLRLLSLPLEPWGRLRSGVRPLLLLWRRLRASPSLLSVMACAPRPCQQSFDMGEPSVPDLWDCGTPSHHCFYTPKPCTSCARCPCSPLGWPTHPSTS